MASVEAAQTTGMRSAESARAATLAPGGVPDVAIQALILRHVHDAVFATDLDNRVTYWGHSAERLFGYSEDQAIGRAFGELLPFRIAGSAGQSDLLETIRSERTWRGEGTVILPSGAELWIESTVNPIAVRSVRVVVADMLAQHPFQLAAVHDEDPICHVALRGGCARPRGLPAVAHTSAGSGRPNR